MELIEDLDPEEARTIVDPALKLMIDAGGGRATKGETFKARIQRSNAPEESGIYGLFSALWIFVGEADNIRARLLQHLTENDPGIRLYQPSGFAFELVSPQKRHQRMDLAIRETEPLLQYRSSADRFGTDG